MEKDDDINRNNNHNNPDYDPNRNNNHNNPNHDPNRNNNHNHNNPNATTLTTAPAQVPELPLEIWCDILKHLGVDAKDVALVSRQLHAAWQMGLLEMHLSPFDLDQLAWMNSRSFHDYPALRTLTLGALEAEATRQRQLISLTVNSASPSPCVTLSLYLNHPTHTRSVCELAREQPELASRVRHLALYRTTGDRKKEEKEPEQTVIDVIKTFPRLHELTLMRGIDFWRSNNSDPQQASPDHAPDAGQSIVRLKLINLDDVGSEKLLALADHFPNVTELVLEACSLSDARRDLCAGAGLKGWPQLHSLSVRTTRHGRGFTDNDLAGIPFGCLYLQLLVLDGPHPISANGLHSITAGPDSSRLTHLALANNPHITDEYLRMLGYLSCLETLHLENLVGLTNEALMAVANCRELTSLTIVGCPGISADAVMQLFAKIPRLRQFNGIDLDSDDASVILAQEGLRLTRNARQNGNQDDQPST
jgi:hypothetical protein